MVGVLYPVAKGYMTDYLRPALKNTGGATERRPTFEHSELVQLLASIPAWILVFEL